MPIKNHSFFKTLENHISQKGHIHSGEKMSEKPTTGFIFSLIGGIFVLLGGLLWSAVGTLLTIFSSIGFLLYAFLVFGIIIIVGALMMNSNPKSAHTWGIVVIILGVLSLIGITTTLGGILSIVGGALALSWNPSTYRKCTNYPSAARGDKILSKLRWPVNLRPRISTMVLHSRTKIRITPPQYFFKQILKFWLKNSTSFLVLRKTIFHAVSCPFFLFAGFLLSRFFPKDYLESFLPLSCPRVCFHYHI